MSLGMLVDLKKGGPTVRVLAVGDLETSVGNHLAISTAPMSQAIPWGRGTPRWSASGQTTLVDVTAAGFWRARSSLLTRPENRGSSGFAGTAELVVSPDDFAG